MRKLMWFTIGFTAACAAGTYLVSGNWLLLLALFSGVGAVAVFYLRSKAGRAAFLIMLGCAGAFLWQWGYDGLYLSTARSYDAQTVESCVQITDYSYETDYGIAADGKLALDGKSYRVRLYLYDDVTLSPGDRVEGSVRLRYTASGGEAETTYHQGKGIFLLAYADADACVTYAEKIPGRYFAAVLRQKIITLLDAAFPADTLAFARALLLGDSSLLSYETDTSFSVSGIRHVIAVSGLHVSILFSLVYLLCGRRRALTALLGIPTLILFAAVAGFTPSIVRACVMQGLMILAMLLDKEYDPPTALAFAVLTMLLANPLTVTSVSFQLSVGCMVGIFLFCGRIHDYLLHEKRFGPAKGKSIKARLTRWIVASVSVTLSAMAVTTPLCACYFGMVSLVGLLTNLLTLWVISFVFYGIMAVCILGAVWLPLGQLIAWVISWPIRYVIKTAEALASFPLAAVYTCSAYIVVWLVLCYVLLAAFLLSKRKHPVVMACCMAVGLAVAVGLSWLEPRLDDYRMTVLDVGQGQCVLLQEGQTYYLVDCGGDFAGEAADTAAQTLLSQGVTRLDGVILTHYDRDHAGGVEALLSRVPADRLYLPDAEDTGAIKERLTDAYAEHITWVEPETEIKINETGITLLAGENGVSDNESSLCVLFQPENCDILITGDRTVAGEAFLMAQTQLPDLEVLVVGHHGAKTSTGFELLSVTRPEIAVISVGQTNSYGHPAQEVLDRLDFFGCQVYRTDQNGTIIFRG